MTKTALITGGAGFIGFHLAKSLANQNYNVTILDNFSRGQEDSEFRNLIDRENVTFVKADITKPETFELLNTNFDYVYHLAAINGTENFYNIPDKVLRVGIVGTLNILDWFVKQKKGKLLFSSSSEAYAGALKLLGEKFPIPTPENVPLVVDDPSNARWSYGASKILSEVAVHSYAKAQNMKNFSIIRYHNIYGPRMGFEHVIPQFIEKIVKEGSLSVGVEDSTRTFCYVDDAVRATQLVMESESTNGDTIHVGRSDGEIKIIELAKKIFFIAGVNPRIEFRPPREGSVKRRCPDTTKLLNLGFKPEIDLDEGLIRCFEWYKTKFS
ncbi:MAG: NAD-dependent epimerase/dehydratase family protein [Nanoarchaeota archaeon]